MLAEKKVRVKSSEQAGFGSKDEGSSQKRFWPKKTKAEVKSNGKSLAGNTVLRVFVRKLGQRVGDCEIAALLAGADRHELGALRTFGRRGPARGGGGLPLRGDGAL